MTQKGALIIEREVVYVPASGIRIILCFAPGAIVCAENIIPQVIIHIVSMGRGSFPVVHPARGSSRDKCVCSRRLDGVQAKGLLACSRVLAKGTPLTRGLIHYVVWCVELLKNRIAFTLVDWSVCVFLNR